MSVDSRKFESFQLSVISFWYWESSPRFGLAIKFCVLRFKLLCDAKVPKLNHYFLSHLFYL